MAHRRHLRDAWRWGPQTAALNQESAAHPASGIRHPASTPPTSLLQLLLHMAADGSVQSDWHSEAMAACPWLAEKTLAGPQAGSTSDANPPHAVRQWG
jgi:hypothetical protein